MSIVHYVIGASGSGKSTRSQELAAEYGPRTRVFSTDVIRAQLRAVMDRRKQPDLWAESFDVPFARGDSTSSDMGINVAGYLRQCEPILRCVEAAVEYALTEGWNVVVEGVHLVPGEFLLPQGEDLELHAELVLVRDAERHRSMFTSRELATRGGRDAAHYHRNLERIRDVQRTLEQRWYGWKTPSGMSRLVYDQTAAR